MTQWDATEIINSYVANRIDPGVEAVPLRDSNVSIEWGARGNRRKVTVILGDDFVMDFNNLAEVEQDRLGDSLAGMAAYILGDPHVRSVRVIWDPDGIKFE